MWVLYHMKILTLDNLQKRGTSLVNRSELCQNDAESGDHLFVECSFTQVVWALFSRNCRFIPQPSDNIRSVILRWSASSPNNFADCVSYYILHAISWNIWLERN
ncbi:unnamed protein product [Linum trigynum]|uniref:Reverse transcriptase zinc-binding domain-containing protein n=1 Tax=Linum trigynum TaxID=586398 RepID=A0AAV2EED8_9ROSI